MNKFISKGKLIAAVSLFAIHSSLFISHAVAQTDPIVMTVAGKPVTLIEF